MATHLGAALEKEKMDWMLWTSFKLSNSCLGVHCEYSTGDLISKEALSFREAAIIATMSGAVA